MDLTPGGAGGALRLWEERVDLTPGGAGFRSVVEERVVLTPGGAGFRSAVGGEGDPPLLVPPVM